MTHLEKLQHSLEPASWSVMLVKYALSFLDAAELNSEPEEKKMLGVTFPSQLCIPTQTKKNKIKKKSRLFILTVIFIHDVWEHWSNRSWERRWCCEPSVPLWGKGTELKYENKVAATWWQRAERTHWCFLCQRSDLMPGQCFFLLLSIHLLLSPQLKPPPPQRWTCHINCLRTRPRLLRRDNNSQNPFPLDVCERLSLRVQGREVCFWSQ